MPAPIKEEMPMFVLIRCTCVLAVLLAPLARCRADDAEWRTKVAKIGKPATALVEVKQRGVQGSAFCIHPSGLFLTNEHVIKPFEVPPGAQVPPVEITLVLNPGQKHEKSYPAKVVRSSKEPDLALLRIEGVKDLPTLALGSDDKLEELLEVVAFGFPFGTELAPNRKDYPAVSANPGSISSLRQKDGTLDRIDLNVTLNPGNSGGPVLDKSGKVVGVVKAGIRGSGVNFAIPVGAVTRFVARPDVEFNPPALTAGNVHEPLEFEARVTLLLPSQAPLNVDLMLKPARGRERTFHMEERGDRFRASAVPLPAPPGPRTLRLLAEFDDGLLNALTTDRAFKVGDLDTNLRATRSLEFKPQPRLVLHDGKTVTGAVTALDAVPVRLGEVTLTVDLTKAARVRFAPSVETDQVWYTLIARQGDKEVLRQSEVLLVRGLLPAPTVGAGSTGIKPPTLEGDKVVRKLPSPVADVAVGGGGRYLVLRLPEERKLAIFDVNTADIAGCIPIAESGARFAAGLEDLVIVLPSAGVIERWSLKTRERDVAATLPIKGIIKAVAMGSASRGPLLLHYALGPQDLDRAALAMINVQTMKVIFSELNLGQAQIMCGNNRNRVHLRASANGLLFGMWCTSHTPTGYGTVLVSENVTRISYAHPWSVGHVLPSPDGKVVYTRSGSYAPQVKMNEMPHAGDSMLPACHGEYYLVLPPFNPRPGPPKPPGTPPAADAITLTIRARGKDKPIATVAGLELTLPNEDNIGHDFTFDKRIHLIPDARLIITIPPSNDQLVLHRFGG
jgi:hypothetical protein